MAAMGRVEASAEKTDAPRHSIATASIPPRPAPPPAIMKGARGERMSDIDGLGEAVTGALLARAVEPGAGEARSSRTTETACLNCATPLAGPYCAACGQKAHVRRSLRGFGADFVAGLFNFEGKFWRTLPMLAWRPGELTRRYIAGERARFISPVALYLFSVFLMFAVLSFSGMIGGDNIGGSVKSNLAEAVADQRESIAKLEVKRRSAEGDAAQLAKHRPPAGGGKGRPCRDRAGACRRRLPGRRDG